MTDDNVIRFPNSNLVSHPQSPEELVQKIAEYKQSYAGEIAEYLSSLVLGELSRAGCEFEDDLEKYYPCMVLMAESIRALHLLHSGVHHPLQDLAASTYEADDNGVIVGYADPDDEYEGDE